MLKTSVIALILSLTSWAQAAVWNNANQWSPTWESRFNNWVQAEWQIDFFSRKTLPNGQSNPYYGLRADCADTVYSMRIVFAYENRLPFVIKDPTASGRTISNQMSRWDDKNETTRIRSFLSYMFNVVSTKSLPNDTYPIAISRKAVRSGSLILTTSKNHHSWTLKEMLPIGVPHLVFNSVIGATSGSGLQQRQSWPNPAWVFEGNTTPSGHAGFRYWRPEATLLGPVWQVPGYSEEQYSVPMSQWVRFAQNRLASTQETDEQMVNRMLNAACEGLKTRVPAVKEGLDFLARNPRCMPYATYDLYSTPNRDIRAFDDLVALRTAYRDMLKENGGNQLSSNSVARLNKIYPKITASASSETASMGQQAITAASVCVTNYGQGRTIDLADFKRRIYAGLLSNNPHDSIEYRWGEKSGSSSLARSCQSWDVWKPNLN